MAEKFLFYIRKRELENNQTCLARPTILRALHKVDGEMRTCEKLKYFKYPEFPLNINSCNIDAKNNSTDLNRKVYELFIRENDLCNESSTPVDRIKFFTQRRVLTKVFTAPYDSTKFTIIAKRHSNMIFMTIKRPESESEAMRNVIDFSQICQRDSPNVQSKGGMTINVCENGDENKPGFIIFGTKLDNFDIIYSNRASLVLSEESVENVANTDVLNNCNFVLTKLINERKEEYWMKTALALRWWSQGFLSAIDDVFIGFIDDQCFIRKPAKLYKLDSIKEVQLIKINVCQTFLCKFLKLIEETTNTDDPWDTIYNFNFDGKGKVTYSLEKREPGSIIFSAEFAEYMRDQ